MTNETRRGDWGVLMPFEALVLGPSRGRPDLSPALVFRTTRPLVTEHVPFDFSHSEWLTPDQAQSSTQEGLTHLSPFPQKHSQGL